MAEGIRLKKNIYDTKNLYKWIDIRWNKRNKWKNKWEQVKNMIVT